MNPTLTLSLTIYTLAMLRPVTAPESVTATALRADSDHGTSLRIREESIAAREADIAVREAVIKDKEEAIKGLEGELSAHVAKAVAARRRLDEMLIDLATTVTDVKNAADAGKREWMEELSRRMADNERARRAKFVKELQEVFDALAMVEKAKMKVDMGYAALMGLLVTTLGLLVFNAVRLWLLLRKNSVVPSDGK